MLTKSMAVELGRHHIRVNCILPGPVDTPLTKVDGVPIPEVQTVLDQMVIKRQIEPNEVARLALFLLSPLSAMITGQSIKIDGGWKL